MKKLAVAIEKASVAIEYLTWAMQETDQKRRLEWLKEAKEFNSKSIEWIEKEMPF